MWGRRASARLLACVAALGLGTFGGLVSIGAPLVVRAPTDKPPPTRLSISSLSGGTQTLRPGWQSSEAPGANLVSVSWSGDPAATFSVQARQHGAWHAIDTVGSEQGSSGPDPGTLEAKRATKALVSEPVWVGNADRIRVRVANGVAKDVRLDRIDTPPATPSDNTASALTPPIPGIISRAAWGADESARLRACPEGPVYTSNVKLAIVHHTGGSNNYGPGDSAGIVRGLYAYAINVLHYCDTHYNFLIDKYGQIFEGRYGGIAKPVLGAHTKGANTDTVGVALIGNYQNVTPPPAMIAALERLLAWKLAWHGVDVTRSVAYTTPTGTDRWPAGTTHILPAIIGHRDPGITDCPGDRAYALLPQIRFNVAVRIARSPIDAIHLFLPTAGAPKLVAASAYGPVYSSGGEPQPRLPGAWPGNPVIRDVEIVPGGAGGYVLDAFGGIHPFGFVPLLTGGPYWRGWGIARDLVLRPGGGAYVLDGWGGVHTVGGAPPIRGGPSFAGHDIARKIMLVGSGAEILDGYGGIHPAGGAPRVAIGAYWPGWDIARDLRTAPSGVGGYVLDGLGAAWPFGGAPLLPTPYFGSDVARSLLLLPGGGGYSLRDSGQLVPFGGAPSVLQARSTYGGAPAVTSPYVIRDGALG
jgi:hypothetical protein